MTIEEKQKAERILRYLCVGAKIEGQMFYGLRLLISSTKKNRKRTLGQLSLVIEHTYAILDHQPEEPYTIESSRSSHIMEDYEKLSTLGLRTIKDIYLGDEKPHLSIVFDNGQVLYVNGDYKDDCWQVELTNDKGYKEGWGVVARSKGEIAFWAPEDILNR